MAKKRRRSASIIPQWDGPSPVTPSREELIGPSELEPDSNVRICPDAAYVLKNFLGKTQSAAQAMFAEAAYYTEDFAYMAHAGLRFYLPPAFDYLQSDDSEEDSDFSHGILCSLHIQAKDESLDQNLKDIILKIAEYVDTHREKFELNAEEDLLDSYIKTIRYYCARAED